MGIQWEHYIFGSDLNATQPFMPLLSLGMDSGNMC